MPSRAGIPALGGCEEVLPGWWGSVCAERKEECLLSEIKVGDIKWGKDSEVQRSVLLPWICPWPWMSQLTPLNHSVLRKSGLMVLAS